MIKLVSALTSDEFITTDWTAWNVVTDHGGIIVMANGEAFALRRSWSQFHDLIAVGGVVDLREYQVVI